MKRTELLFQRPVDLQAVEPPERRGLARDQVRLLVSAPGSHRHDLFANLDRHLSPGDLLVVNESATLPASLPSLGIAGEFLVNLSTYYGRGLWVVEPRWDEANPGPIPFDAGEEVHIGGLIGRMICPFPGIPRLWFMQVEGRISDEIQRRGRPIRYGYTAGEFPLGDYQTIFSRFPGSAEMPSAGRPFTRRVLSALEERGVEVAAVLLHTGVSSLEVESDSVEAHPLYPEPYRVPEQAVLAIQRARERGSRVIAVGTTVVRALESAWAGTDLVPRSGFTRLFLHPGRGLHVVDGLITGFHDPATSHLALLYALAGEATIRSAYREAVREGYLWHEFGDSHLILPPC